jgi:hypothetical protein
MKKTAYIDFENETYYYKLFYGEVVNGKELLIRKGIGALRRLLTMVEEDPTVSSIVFLDVNKKPYNTLYVNYCMVMLVREQELITINLITENVVARELDWWVNDDKDFENFLEELLKRNEIQFDDEMINSIITRFKYQ